jgi:MSHA pilin protein MshD
MYARSRQHGVTLIELIVFIVIVGVALTGMLTVLNLTARTGADPMIRKQMLAIAEGLMDEVAAQPFTWCDPDDASAATATSAAVGAPPTFCTATVEAIGPEALETRGPLTPLFDNVNDYNGLAGITTSITGTPMPAGYTAAITVAPSALGPAANLVPAAASLLITVTVSFNTENLTIEGYRTRYVPNLLP